MTHRAITKSCISAFNLSVRKYFVRIVVVLFILGLLSALGYETHILYLSVEDIQVKIGKSEDFQLIQVGEFTTSLRIICKIKYPDIVVIQPATIDITGTGNPRGSAVYSHNVKAFGTNLGHSSVTLDVRPSGVIKLDKVALHATVVRYKWLNVVSLLMGWTYCMAWSALFYPQMYHNWKRRSVVGLNFDLISLNLYGFIMYSLFNGCLYWSYFIQTQYEDRYPRSVNPVHFNDVFFSLHATLSTFLTAAQCYHYERGSQRVSVLTKVILTIFFITVIVSCFSASVGSLSWLGFLYYCSYIKLVITFFVYLIQAYLNCFRMSISGWGYGNIILDFIGGSLSICQMLVNAYNCNDWISIYGFLGKFGLGLCSVTFDCFFVLQQMYFRSRQ